ncbi:MAG TPA: malto-oligosyltrehalose synthase [Stellaceae bacterium]|nr:malto-oligosyltrehalose synthase [Stellaceae bacterium]
MAEDDGDPPPRATYRLQFREEFGFDDAAALAPYLARLGISHLYASPYLAARPGSPHGYDIVDHERLNPELGGEAAFARMVAALRDNGLQQILDFVPNHMGVGGADNPLWLDVLEWGPDSACAGWFDIDWEPDRRYLHDKLLVPFLADQYGLELERGALRLRFDAAAGAFAVWAYDTHKLPICPLFYPDILGEEDPVLERLGDSFAELPAWRPRIERRAAQLKAGLADAAGTQPAVAAAIAAAIVRINGRDGEFATWQRLDVLIGRQYWRLAHFRVAADDINYRRFFNINELAGLRMELPEVFEHAHRLVFRLIGDGSLAGLRIDHIDGLLDPAGYLHRLREAAPRRDFYLVVEKILAPHESLREDWPVAGTTGYDFAGLVLGLLVDPAGEAPLSDAYERFAGPAAPFDEIVRAAKLRIMDHEMASELNVLAREAGRIARQNPRTADFTRNILRRALRATIAAFPVYRTYVDARGAPSEADRRDLDWAIAQARRHEPLVDPSVFNFVHRLLSGDLVAEPRSGFSREAVLRHAMRVQQYSGPVMAKGLEDTAFYRYNRLIALNEVGARPDEFGVSIAAFHHANRRRAERWPHAMLATSTHDMKRGEDARARLAVLSEMAEEWSERVPTWSRLLRARRGDVEGTAPPERNDEYLFYQLLVGTWPLELLDGEPDGAALASYAGRVKAAMVKSIREAKLYSSWTMPDPRYEEAALSFVEGALDPARAGAFLASFLPFVWRVAELGAHNTLVQTVLKLTVPGVPDIYQGAELWDFSMVDPDNRRPVDYRLRTRLLDEVTADLAADRPAAMRAYAGSWRDGRLKLAVTTTLLACRRAYPGLFAAGGYEPLAADGPDADRVCTFLRTNGEEAMIVAVARFPKRLAEDALCPESRIALPEMPHRAGWYDALSGAAYGPCAALDARRLFALLPAAVLCPRPSQQKSSFPRKRTAVRLNLLRPELTLFRT